jgi:hypothetical protein
MHKKGACAVELYVGQYSNKKSGIRMEHDDAICYAFFNLHGLCCGFELCMY